MNIRNIKILQTLAALLLSVVAGSCSQDELAADHGVSLTPGKHPLLFTASINEMTSRADVSDPWGNGDEIAVQIEDYPVVGRYTLNVDGSVKEANNPLAWPFAKGHVRAWYPYIGVGKTIEKQIDDQSGGYHDIDFLYAATDNEEHYKNTVDLRFRHMMAKVSCRFTKGEGVTDDDLETIRVSYFGNTSISFKEGTVTGSGEGWVAADTAHTALLVPKTVADRYFIKVEITLTVNGVKIEKEFTCATSGFKLDAGYHYVYNITVGKDRLEVKPITAAWTDEGTPGAADLAVVKVNMPKDLPDGCREMLSFSDNVLNGDAYKAGDVSCLEVKGNEFTIFYPAEISTLLEFSIAEDSEKDPAPDFISNPKDELELGKGKLYEVNFNLRSSQVGLKWDFLIISPKVGDYYYADGTWSTYYRGNKTCLGIVVKTGVDPTDTDNDWLPEGEEILGYVLALRESSTVWIEDISAIPTELYNKLEKGATNTFDGYSRTKKTVDILSDYNTAAHKAQNWEPDNVPPSSSSGWYLPSAKQMLEILRAYTTYSKKLTTDCDGTPINTGSANNYWSSTLSNNKTAYVANRSSNGTKSMTATVKLRPVLTFTTPRNNEDNE